MTEQLFFTDLLLTPPADFDNFISGQNQEVYLTLTNLASGQAIYLWGLPASGKSHLLKATQTYYKGEYFNADTFPDSLTFVPDAPIICIDDVNLLNEAQQDTLFNLYNKWQLLKARDQAFTLIVSGDAAPKFMVIREDLRNRLGWGLVYGIETLSDGDAQLAFAQRAFDKGLPLSKEVTPWLFTHYTRDIRTLLALLDALDAYSLAHKRTITLPLLKDFLHAKENLI